MSFSSEFFGYNDMIHYLIILFYLSNLVPHIGSGSGSGYLFVPVGKLELQVAIVHGIVLILLSIFLSHCFEMRTTIFG